MLSFPNQLPCPRRIHSGQWKSIAITSVCEQSVNYLASQVINLFSSSQNQQHLRPVGHVPGCPNTASHRDDFLAQQLCCPFVIFPKPQYCSQECIAATTCHPRSYQGRIRKGFSPRSRVGCRRLVQICLSRQPLSAKASKVKQCNASIASIVCDTRVQNNGRQDDGFSILGSTKCASTKQCRIFPTTIRLRTPGVLADAGAAAHV